MVATAPICYPKTTKLVIRHIITIANVYTEYFFQNANLFTVEHTEEICETQNGNHGGCIVPDNDDG